MCVQLCTCPALCVGSGMNQGHMILPLAALEVLLKKEVKAKAQL